jgi:hypothetical protein
MVLMLIELVKPPVLIHARMQEVLIYSREFVLEYFVQMRDDLFIAFHILVCLISLIYVNHYTATILLSV